MSSPSRASSASPVRQASSSSRRTPSRADSASSLSEEVVRAVTRRANTTTSLAEQSSRATSGAVWALLGAASSAKGAALHAGGAAKHVIQQKRAASSWYQRRQKLRSSVFAAQKWVCGPFLGRFDDINADPDDDREERQYEDEACGKVREGGRGQKYLDMPVGSLPNEHGYGRNKESRQAKSPVNAIKKMSPAELLNFQNRPDLLFNDLWETILVNVENNGVTKKKRMGQLIIDQLSPDGPVGEINKLMRWPVPDFEVDEDTLRKEESTHIENKKKFDARNNLNQAEQDERRENNARIKQIQDARGYLKLKSALRDRKALKLKRPLLHTLEIIGCRLLEVPPVLRDVPSLRHLKLSHNEIKLLTEEWLWPEDDRPAVEVQYIAKKDHLTGPDADEVGEQFGEGIPCYLCEPREGEDNLFRLIDRVPGDEMRWWETKWGRKEVTNDDMARPVDEAFWKEIRPQRPDDDEAITEWILTWPEGDGGRILAYPMRLAGHLIISREELDVRETGSLVSDVAYQIVNGERELPQLEHLFLDWNSIYSIEVGALSGGVVAKLQVVNLSRNQLNVLPADFMDGARELRYLDLTGNEKIRIIPDTVMECSKLELLFLTHNAIEKLPPIRKEDDFGRMRKRLKKLRKLFVAYNRLTELPEHIGDCRRLEKIRLSHNCIREMPRSLLKLANTLQEFAFVGNPLQQPLTDGASIETNMRFFEDYWLQRDSAEEDPAAAGPSPLEELQFGTVRTLAQTIEAEATARGQEDEVDVIHRPSNVGRFEANPRGPAHRRE